MICDHSLIVIHFGSNRGNGYGAAVGIHYRCVYLNLLCGAQAWHVQWRNL